jgi:hypothetical protein
MDMLQSALLPILTSATVAGIVSLLLKTWFDKRLEEYKSTELERFKLDLKNDFDKNLEEYKSQLRVTAETGLERIKLDLKNAAELSQDTAKKRREACAKISDALYRLRNMTRDIVGSDPVEVDRLEELEDAHQELQNTLYSSRIYLEGTGVWQPLLKHRTAYATVRGNLLPVDRFRKSGEVEQEMRATETLRKSYRHLEDEDKRLQMNLAAFMMSNPSEILDMPAALERQRRQDLEAAEAEPPLAASNTQASR